MTPKPQRNKPGGRVHMLLGEKGKAELEALRDRIGADTFTETHRRAVKLYHELLDIRDAGGVVTARYPDESQESY